MLYLSVPITKELSSLVKISYLGVVILNAVCFSTALNEERGLAFKKFVESSHLISVDVHLQSQHVFVLAFSCMSYEMTLPDICWWYLY